MIKRSRQMESLGKPHASHQISPEILSGALCREKPQLQQVDC